MAVVFTHKGQGEVAHHNQRIGCITSVDVRESDIGESSTSSESSFSKGSSILHAIRENRALRRT